MSSVLLLSLQAKGQGPAQVSSISPQSSPLNHPEVVWSPVLTLRGPDRAEVVPTLRGSEVVLRGDGVVRRSCTQVGMVIVLGALLPQQRH